MTEAWPDRIRVEMSELIPPRQFTGVIVTG
jgi:hypothetical protein